MKCNMCKVAERHEGMAYCKPCNAKYIKEYRAKKKLLKESVIPEEGSRIKNCISKDWVMDGCDPVVEESLTVAKAQRCQADRCTDFGQETTLMGYKTYLCSRHATSMRWVFIAEEVR